MPFKKKKLMISAASIASFALIMTLTFGLLYTPAYAVSMDGEQLGVVSDTETAQRAVESAQAEVENAIGVSAVITDDISIGWTMASKNDLVSEEELTERLLEQVEESREGYVLSVGGQAVGFSPDRETLDSMLDELSAPYQNESTKEVRFEPEVSIEYRHPCVPMEHSFYNCRRRNALWQPPRSAVPPCVLHNTLWSPLRQLLQDRAVERPPHRTICGNPAYCKNGG